jgi:type VI protein secretion system component VasF
MMSSAPAKNRTPLWGIFSLLAAGVGAFSYLKFRQRRQAEALQEADQIARIEGG